MRITRLDAKLLRLPPAGPVSLPLSGANAGARSALDVLLVQVETDAGATGLGVAPVAGGRALLAAIAEDLSPLLVGENALNHERLFARVQALDNPAAQRAYALVDIALWDLKGKAAGLPLWRLLGGARESARAFTAEAADGRLSADEVIAAGRAATGRGLTGLRLGVRGVDPEGESRKVVTVRETLGDDVWFAVSVENPFDYETALPMARFIEEEVGADWFEDPLADDDLAGYALLASRVDTPLAAGGRFTSPAQFLHLLKTGTPVTLRPDPLCLGGLTPLLKVAALAELHRRPLVPRVAPEIGVHLACGLPGVPAAEHAPWLAPLFAGPAAVVEGKLVPPDRPGLGLETSDEIVGRFLAP